MDALLTSFHLGTREALDARRVIASGRFRSSAPRVTGGRPKYIKYKIICLPYQLGLIMSGFVVYSSPVKTTNKDVNPCATGVGNVCAFGIKMLVTE